jgi:hypothetical protein
MTFLIYFCKIVLDVNFKISPPASLKAQRAQRANILSIAVERTANENPQSLHNLIYFALATDYSEGDYLNSILPERRLFFNF